MLEIQSNQKRQNIIETQQVHFIKYPIFNQVQQNFIMSSYKLQNLIDSVQLYVRKLNGLDSMSLKNFFTFQNNFSIFDLEYEANMNALFNYNINNSNMKRLNKLCYNYYNSLIKNINSITHVIVNVNYTRNQTHINCVLIYFINQCMSLVLQNIFNKNFKIDARTVHKTDKKLLKCIKQNNKKLYNTFNNQLITLQNDTFYKYTNDNDANKLQQIYYNKRLYEPRLDIKYVDCNIRV
ncbi:hypothetical protein [Urbanus proteus nucleopolyhedrovirus]|uniref:Uncharacterized protein n=1 Tax=Urbanus proteus nucleopolyhedrovirus TaxID=1675866 RepID=A0A162GUK1_9ABAC|nr:hypothetical protein [Urbanus proteus nucleopolyhedrovirus]AKR17349.2 hypothetical protein [Urbanus proteus nucleopolyhedrovirus]